MGKAVAVETRTPGKQARQAAEIDQGAEGVWVIAQAGVVREAGFEIDPGTDEAKIGAAIEGGGEAGDRVRLDETVGVEDQQILALGLPDGQVDATAKAQVPTRLHDGGRRELWPDGFDATVGGAVVDDDRLESQPPRLDRPKAAEENVAGVVVDDESGGAPEQGSLFGGGGWGRSRHQSAARPATYSSSASFQGLSGGSPRSAQRRLASTEYAGRFAAVG